MGHAVVGMVTSGRDAIQAAVELRPQLVLMDVGLPGDLDGLTAASHIWAQLQIPVIYLTGYTDTRTLAQAGTPQPLLHLQKPFDERILRDTLQRALTLLSQDPPYDVPAP